MFPTTTSQYSSPRTFASDHSRSVELNRTGMSLETFHLDRALGNARDSKVKAKGRISAIKNIGSWYPNPRFTVAQKEILGAAAGQQSLRDIMHCGPDLDKRIKQVLRCCCVSTEDATHGFK